MPDLPVMLKVHGKRAVIVGGGPVAVRRAKALVECGADITVIAPRVDAALGELSVRVELREYRQGDLAGAALVVIATDHAEVNDAVHRDAKSEGALVNRADDPEAGDLAVMAHERRGPLTVAVSTGGTSARAAAAIRDELLRELDEDWVTLLEGVAPYRARLQSGNPNPARRHLALVRMTDDEAMGVLKESGPAGLRAHCESIVREAEKP